MVNTVSKRQEIATVIEDFGDEDITVGNLENNWTANQTAVIVKLLERCFNRKIDMKMSKIVDTLEDRIQNKTLTAFDSFVFPNNELAFRSLNASYKRDATSVKANSERGEQIGMTAPFEIVFEKNITLHIFKLNDESRNNIPDEVGELSVPGTQFYRKPHSHHRTTQVLEDFSVANRVAERYSLNSSSHRNPAELSNRFLSINAVLLSTMIPWLEWLQKPTSVRSRSVFASYAGTCPSLQVNYFCWRKGNVIDFPYEVEQSTGGIYNKKKEASCYKEWSGNKKHGR